MRKIGKCATFSIRNIGILMIVSICHHVLKPPTMWGGSSICDFNAFSVFDWLFTKIFTAFVIFLYLIVPWILWNSIRKYFAIAVCQIYLTYASPNTWSIFDTSFSVVAICRAFHKFSRTIYVVLYTSHFDSVVCLVEAFRTVLSTID